MTPPPRSASRPLPRPAAVPHVLIADDDPASRRFLHDAMIALGATAEACGDGAAAIRAAGTTAFDLLLLDCRMPRAGASEVLAQLQGDAEAASHAAVAVATTAELAPAHRPQLLAEGFADILLKPCQFDDLRRVLRLTPAHLQQLPVLDDDAALLASGDSHTMAALRQLLQQELIAVRGELDNMPAQSPAFRDRLHRLRSSCGFCGATALSAQVAALERQLASAPERAQAAMARFQAALMETLDALDEPPG
ncbi:response regulator [Dyella sp.]|uniref:response regulator n=1 Tax=Dyella sp. TaxID=1869338 RepID=UPI002D766CB7|nr:response regulator [Dyella sp.]HET6431483.1 response regulator [Dyella sp.]